MAKSFIDTRMLSARVSAGVLEYSLDGESYSVTGIGTVHCPDLVIPSEYNGLPVTAIHTDAFADNEDITSVSIPNGITSIGDNAFSGCTNINSIAIPNTITSIGSGAFRGCSSVMTFDFSAHTTVPYLASTDAFEGISSDCTIRVSPALYFEWIEASNWSELSAYIIFFCKHDYSGYWEADSDEHWKVCEVCGEIGEVAKHIPGAEATVDHPQVCTVCGYELAPQLDHAHQYTTAEVVAPTCTTDGYTTYTCEECKETIVDTIIAALGHKMESTVLSAPSCTKKGVRYSWCARGCGNNFTTDIDPLGHTSQIIPSVAPTCTSDGRTSGTECSVCGAILTATTKIDALGHDYQGTYGNITATTHTLYETCRRCGALRQTTSAHVFTTVGDYRMCWDCGYQELR